MKKVLIITYYWPPAGGPGVQRWLSFVKYLRDFNIEPVVYTPEGAHYPIVDESLSNKIPEGITILKTPIMEPYKWASRISSKKTKQISSGIITKSRQSFTEKLMLWVRGNFFVPDARKFWVKPSVKFLNRYIKEHHIETVITTGPPHSLHLIGMKLQEQIGVKWIADFRDPWTRIGYHKELKLSSAAARKHIHLEKQVLQKANLLVTTSYTTAQEFEGLSGRSAEVITNGYEDFSGQRPSLSRKFTLAHTGSLLSDRNPEVLWKVLSDLTREKEGFGEDLEVALTGTTSSEVVNSMEKHGLTPYLKLTGYQPHRTIREIQLAAQVLLLIEINRPETRGIIPGKLFEYMASGRPILAVGPERWDVKKIIKQTNTGAVFSYEDYKGLRENIESMYNDFKNESLKAHGIGIKEFSRKSLTAKLAKKIHDL